MKFLKKLLIVLAILMLFCFLFKGWIYRKVFEYKIIGERPSYNISDSNLKNIVDQSFDYEGVLGLNSIVEASLKITKKHLSFSSDKCYSDPNKLIESKKANCIGYASFFSTICNYLLEKNSLSDQWQAKSKVCKLYTFGINIHNYINSPFFKDHDCAVIENKLTVKAIAVDPSLSDLFDIELVTIENVDRSLPR